MLGELDYSRKTVTIVGGGMAGLLAAWRLKTLGFQVSLYEKSKHCGGLVGSWRASHGLVEQAAHSLRASPAVQQVADTLGVELAPLREGVKGGRILRGGKMRRWPLKMGESLTLLKRALLVRGDGQPATLAGLTEKHLGPAGRDWLVTAMTLGVFGTTPDNLHVPTAFDRFLMPPGKTLFAHMWPQRRQSRGGMVAPKHGMQNFVDALVAALQDGPTPARLNLGEEVTELPHADNVILATPAPVAASLLTGTAPETAEALRQVSYAPLITATVFVKKTAAPNLPKAIGVLAPPQEGRQILGILFNATSFPNRVRDDSLTSLTVLMGGTLHPQLLSQTDDQLRTLITSELRHTLGLRSDLEALHLRRWPQAIPLYNETLSQAWASIKTHWCNTPGHILFGNYTGAVSLRGMMETVMGWNVTS